MDHNYAERADTPRREDEFSLVEVANTILRNWRVIAILPVVLALIVGIRGLSQQRTYAAVATFMPQAAEGRASGGTAALAQRFGVSLGSGAGQSPEFFVDLLYSRAVLRKVVESEFEVPTAEGQTRRATLIELYGIEDGTHRTPPWRRAIKKLAGSISTVVTRQTGVVEIRASASDPILAERIAERLLEVLNEFNLEFRQSRAQEEGRFIAARVAEAQSQLLAAEGALQRFLRQNREFRNSPDLTFDHDRLQRQVAMYQELYTSLLRAQEQVRLDVVRDTPLLTVIDHPAGTAEPVARGTVIRAILAFMLGLMGAVFVAFVAEFARRSREAEDPRHREFQRLVRQAWDDLRHPGRWARSRASVAAGDR